MNYSARTHTHTDTLKFPVNHWLCDGRNILCVEGKQETEEAFTWSTAFIFLSPLVTSLFLQIFLPFILPFFPPEWTPDTVGTLQLLPCGCVLSVLYCSVSNLLCFICIVSRVLWHQVTVTTEVQMSFICMYVATV